MRAALRSMSSSKIMCEIREHIHDQHRHHNRMIFSKKKTHSNWLYTQSVWTLNIFVEMDLKYLSSIAAYWFETDWADCWVETQYDVLFVSSTTSTTCYVTTMMVTYLLNQNYNKILLFIPGLVDYFSVVDYETACVKAGMLFVINACTFHTLWNCIL